MPLVGLEPGPFDPESSALTTGPLTPHLIKVRIGRHEVLLPINQNYDKI